MLRHAPPADTRRDAPPRRGSSLLIVIILLSLLTTLAVVFYTLSTQSRLSGVAYSEVFERTAASDDVDVMMDFALKQLILGGARSQKNSAFWGGRHSLVGTSLGMGGDNVNRDSQPFNGAGVRVRWNGTALQVVSDSAGTVGDSSLLDLNDSPAAQNGTERNIGAMPASDVDYTAPDINSPFLAYKGYVQIPGTNNVVRVIIPSFHRPQYLRETNGNTFPSQATGANTNWFDMVETRAKIFRPHPDHIIPGSNVKRFTSAFPFRPSSNADAESSPATPPQGGFQGVWDPAALNAATDAEKLLRMSHYSYDADNDLDGTKEGIWLDLDAPVSRDESGNLRIPLYSMTVYDLDSLLNLNAHGNASMYAHNSQVSSSPNLLANAYGGLTNFTGQTALLSQSNLGMTPSEVNPQWGFPAVPGTHWASGDLSATTTRTYQGFAPFAKLPAASAPFQWAENANMDWFFVMMGMQKRKADGSEDTLISGRYAEKERLDSWLSNGYPLSNPQAQNYPLPGPGIVQVDDNRDVYEGESGIWPFKHPSDFRGLGSYQLATGADRFRRLALNDGLLGYSFYSNTQNVRLAGSPVANIMMNSVQYSLWDDPAEMSFYDREKQRWTSDNTGAGGRFMDEPYSADEVAYLHLPKDRHDEYGVEGRLKQMELINFTIGDRSNRIRQRFTTLSNDRRQFSWPRDASRSWEWTAEPQANGRLVFPPAFGSVVRSTVNAQSNDPFRYPTRAQLQMVENDRAAANPQTRLSLNQVVAFNPSSRAFEQRPLTPHPKTGVTAGVLSGVPNLYPPQTANDAERWARYDRQILARDLYVLLYTFGSRDGLNPTASNAGNAVYTAAQLKEMAQFAVNVVDAMDPDDVMTAFEYDTDLSNGWGLDDNAFSDNSGAETERAVVYGVEAQTLTLSEALAVKFPRNTTSASPGENAATSWKEDEDTFFAHLELKNVSAFPVAFSNREEWQVEVIPQGAAPNDARVRRLFLRNGAGAVPQQGLRTVGGSNRPKDPANMDLDRGMIKVDFDAEASPPIDLTSNTTFVSPKQRKLDVDLVDHETDGWFKILPGNLNPWDSAMATTYLLDQTNAPAVTETITVRLKRRVNPYRGTAPVADANEDANNPFVTVDQLTLSMLESQPILSSDKDTQLKDRLKVIHSRERAQPLDRAVAADHPDDAGGFSNSMGDPTGNSNRVAATILQRQFDRDYASVGELLYVPLFGPENVTLYQKYSAQTPRGQAAVDYTAGNPLNGPLFPSVATAEAKFLQPRFPGTDRTRDNRWHRVLELVEVPSRINKNMVETDDARGRVPGRVNLNTLRFPEVLAGLLDEQNGLTYGGALGLANNPLLQLTTNGSAFAGDTTADGGTTAASRDWFQQFIQSRDLSATDPLYRGGGTAWPGQGTSFGLPLPGLPGAAPFRSFAETSRVNDAGNEPRPASVMRPLRGDLGGLNAAPNYDQDARHLLELGTSTDHLSGNGTGAFMDPLLRHQLLSKTLQNTTTRSNTFVVFLSIKFFLVDEDPATGLFRVGAPATSDPLDHNGVFVIDRSKLETAYDPARSQFNWRAFVESRKILY